MGKKKKKKSSGYLLVLFIALFVAIYNSDVLKETYSSDNGDLLGVSYQIEDIPEYNGNSYVYINGNKPNFKEEDINTESFEIYGALDSLGRCTYTFANLSRDLMPKNERESIGSIRPSGWHTVKYDFIEGKYLYNRCHLIGYQLTGENANNRNLITCTRKMNTGTMLEYENRVANYIKKTNNHVLYRVIPVFDDDNLLAKGVLMEGLSVEDKGEGIMFNIFVYNVQDGIIIDYSNGDSYIE